MPEKKRYSVTHGRVTLVTHDVTSPLEAVKWFNEITDQSVKLEACKLRECQPIYRGAGDN